MVLSFGQVGIPMGLFKPAPSAQSFFNWLDERLGMSTKNIFREIKRPTLAEKKT